MRRGNGEAQNEGALELKSNLKFIAKMTHKKDLFQLFRDNEHKLREAPSARSWQRLEQRLDGRRGRRHFRFSRSLSMVAAVLALAVLVSLISLLAGGNENRFLASNGRAIPVGLEDLRQTDADPLDLQTVKIAQQAQQQLRRPISEGTPSQKLVLANQSPSSSKAAIETFRWLVGQWSSTYQGKTATVIWQQINDASYAATATPEGQEQPSEQMSIYQDGKQLFFSFGAGTSESAAGRYALVSLNGEEAVFENAAAGFPRQVVFSRTGNDELRIIYQGLPPGQETGQTPRPLVRQLRRLRLQ